ncbi:TIM29 translocase, partial [Sakesphorus luctuosus]|nr:TIM29 translocase [Sakesphorus luctuosus]
GIVAVAREVPQGGDCALYSALCPHLRPRGWQLAGQVVDVGFLGRWWALERALRDWDINEAEFVALPEPLRRLDPRALRSEG